MQVRTLSDFTSLNLIDSTLKGTAPQRFQASTAQTLAVILSAGYLNNISKKIKANDIFEINYLDNSTFPLNTGEAALYGEFKVQYDPVLENWNLIPVSNVQEGIAAFGVHSATYSNAGGSTTITIPDANITPNHVVIARFQSSANASIVKTVAPGNGQIVMVVTANPGVSVVEYIAFLPSVVLQNQGVYGAQYTNAGGSATITIANANITTDMVVNANFLSQTNTAEIKTAIADTGLITIVATADPGASVIEYMAVLPSTDLTTEGLYAAKLAIVGGSATTVISDGQITATSIVTADWASQTNAVEIQKVTPGAATLTILSSGDPGASVINYMATPEPEGAQAGTFVEASSSLVAGNLVEANGMGSVIDSGIAASGLQILSASVTLNQAQIQGMYGAPFQIIPAVANKVIVPVQMTLYTNFQTSAFAGGGVGILQYDNTVHGAGTNALAATIPAAEITAAASQIYNLGARVAAALTGITNKGLFLSNQTGAFTGGDAASTVVVTVSYYLVTATV